MKRDKIKEVLLGCISILFILLLWQLASSTGLFGKFEPRRSQILLPSPGRVFDKLIEICLNGYLPHNIWLSLKRVLIGFLVAVVIGVPVGILIGLNDNIRYLVQPVISFVVPIPGVAWVPLAILWFGLGDDAAIFIIIVSSVSPIIINTFQGMKAIDSNLRNVMKMLHANRWQTVYMLIIPSIMPYMFTGFRLGLGYAWRVVIAAEMVGVPDGLGYVLNLGRNTAQTELTFITILTLCVLMTLMERGIFDPVEKKLSRWQVQQSMEVGK